MPHLTRLAPWPRRLAVTTILAFSVRAGLADTVSWNVDAAGDWATASNWSSNPNLPGPADDVTIDHPAGNDPVSLSYGTSASINSLFTTEPLTISGNLTVATTLQTANTLTLNGALQNATLSTTPGGSVVLTPAARLQNVTTLSNLFVPAYGAAVVDGTLTLSCATLSLGSYASLRVQNNPTFAGTGLITIGPSSGYGVVNIYANSTLRFPSLISTNAANISLNDYTANFYTLSGSTSAFAANLTNTGNISLTGAIFPANVLLNGGTLSGSGTVAGIITAGTNAHVIQLGNSTSTSASVLYVAGLVTGPATTLSFHLFKNFASDSIQVYTTNPLTLNGGTVQIITSPASPPSLGYYKILTYSSLAGDPSSLTLPAPSNNIVYTLDTTRNPGYIDLHLGFLGDANDDGIVNNADLQTLLNNFGSHTSSWNAGNFENQPAIDLTDLSYVLNNFGLFAPSASSQDSALSPQSSTLVPIPEPTTFTLLLPALLLAHRARSRRLTT